jgi:AraC family transcriptional regulator of adaptative response/methylated-DNA-[protein]-cysteine methyltransferase
LEKAMLSPDRISSPAAGTSLQDYDTVRQALRFITEKWRDQPEIEAIAHACGVTPDELHHLFRRWAGLTPKAFLQAITIDHARSLLRDSASVLDAAYEVGLSGPGRLHDLFVTHEAMSPGEWKTGGEGLTMHYGFHESPFGKAIVVATERGLAGLGFADPGEEKTAIDDMQRRWPRARLEEDATRTAPIARRIFDQACWRKDQPLRVVMIGTDFEVRVWETLLGIPMGRASTYSDITGASPASAPCSAGKRGRRRQGKLRRQFFHLRHGRIRIEPIDQRHAGGEFALDNAIGRQALQHHDQRTQRIAMCGDEYALALEHARQDFRDVIR